MATNITLTQTRPLTFAFYAAPNLCPTNVNVVPNIRLYACFYFDADACGVRRPRRPFSEPENPMVEERLLTPARLMRERCSNVATPPPRQTLRFTVANDRGARHEGF